MAARWFTPAARDHRELRRVVARAREEYLATGRLSCRVRDVVRDSWTRCHGIGLDPELTRPRIAMTADELHDYRAQHPLAAVLHIVRRLLVDSAAGDGHLVGVADARGRLLWVDGAPVMRGLGERIGFVEGADWSERSAGTNAPGTALVTGEPVQILFDEHWTRPVQTVSCAAAPVHDPDTGAVLGVLDLTGGDDVAAPQALALVQAAAVAAETELRLLRCQGRLPTPTGDPGAPPRLCVLGRDQALLSVRGRTIALSPRHSEVLFLLTRHPQGLTAGALAVRLHEQEPAPVTVRAEMSRLRALVGADVVASRPYRLAQPVTTDADDVLRLLERGAPRLAMQRYTGPILPGSVAPGVVEERADLDALVRRAMLRL